MSISDLTARYVAEKAYDQGVKDGIRQERERRQKSLEGVTIGDLDRLSAEFEEMLWMHAPQIDTDWGSLAWNACLPVAHMLIENERERIREALLSDGAVKAVDGIWKFPTKGMERTNRMRLAAALDHIGLGADTTEGIE